MRILPIPENAAVEDTDRRQTLASRGGLETRLRSLRRQVEQAYEDSRNDVYYYLLTTGISPADAQDVTQETFLRLYIALRDGDDIRSVRGWIFRVAHNAALKLRQKRSQLQAVDTGFGVFSSPGETPESSAIDSQRRALLDAAIRDLSPQQRQCLHLRAEGLRYQEIADAIGISVSSVAVFLRRAVSKLRRVANE
jgi:RNA polymerase sigma-70 factor (ECF subfamily)